MTRASDKIRADFELRHPALVDGLNMDWLEAQIDKALRAAHEACAQIAEQVSREMEAEPAYRSMWLAPTIARHIRARGQAE